MKDFKISPQKAFFFFCSFVIIVIIVLTIDHVTLRREMIQLKKAVTSNTMLAGAGSDTSGNVEQKLSELESYVDDLVQNLNNFKQNVNNLEQDVYYYEQNVSNLELKVNNVESNFGSLESRVRSHDDFERRITYLENSESRTDRGTDNVDNYN